VKPELTQSELIKKAREFCETESIRPIPELFGTTDGKAVGTYIERRFKSMLQASYIVEIGNSAHGIDLPSINTDLKTTSFKQPQSSCPFKSARQKIYGLGYNLLLFVYDKRDDTSSQTANLRFVSCAFIDASRTGDYQTTRGINEILQRNGNKDDIFAFLEERRLPVDEIGMSQLADEIMQNPPTQGYLTISNALQWRLQYGRIVELDNSVDGIIKIV